jgi:hypothetical protein
MKDFNIMGYICSGECWGMEPRRRPDGTYDDTAETVMELLLARMYWGLRAQGHSPDSARAELNAWIMEIADQPEDPFGQINFEILFKKPGPPEDEGAIPVGDRLKKTH